MKGLVHRLLGGEREACVDLGGNLAGDDVEDLLAELHQEVVEGGIDLLLDGAAVLLAVLNGGIDQLRVLGLLGGSEDERGVGGRILGLVLVNGRKVTGVADNGGARGLQLIEAGRHCVCGGGISKAKW